MLQQLTLKCVFGLRVINCYVYCLFEIRRFKKVVNTVITLNTDKEAKKQLSPSFNKEGGHIELLEICQGSDFRTCNYDLRGAFLMTYQARSAEIF